MRLTDSKRGSGPLLRARLGRGTRTVTACLVLVSGAQLSSAQDSTRTRELLASSRLNTFRLLSVSKVAGEPTAVLSKLWEVSRDDESRAIALDPPPSVTVHVGDELRDARVLEIDVAAREVLIRQRLDDPRLIKPFRDVLFTLRPPRSRPALMRPPLSVTVRPAESGRIILDGTTWPACRVACLRGQEVVAELISEMDGHFQVRLDSGGVKGDPVRVVARGMLGETEWLVHPSASKARPGRPE